MLDWYLYENIECFLSAYIFVDEKEMNIRNLVPVLHTPDENWIHGINAFRKTMPE